MGGKHGNGGRLCTVLLALILVTHGGAAGIGAGPYRNAEEEVLGLDGVLSAALSYGAGVGASRTAVLLEAGEKYLFEVDELRRSYSRVGLMRGAAGMFVSGILLSSPVGSEKTIAVETFYFLFNAFRHLLEVSRRVDVI